MRSGSDPLAAVNLLDLAPVRAVEWHEEGGRVVLHRPWPSGYGPRALFDRLRYYMTAKRIRLDESGSLAWRLLDGRRSVRQVAAGLRGELGEAVEPAEERLGKLVRMLREERLLAYPGYDTWFTGIE